MRKIQLEASRRGWRLMRNQTGAYHVGKRFIRYGVGGKGGADLIGWTDTGRFVAIEVKAGSPTTAHQVAFLKAVIRAGGIGIVAHSISDVWPD